MPEQSSSTDPAIVEEKPYVRLTAKEFKKKYGFTRVEAPDERPWQLKLHDASKGWGWFGGIIQGMLFNKAMSNLSKRRDS